jgi:hypothetical protein
MSDQEGKRAQREALRAAETSGAGPGDRARAHEDALARYLRLQAAGAKRRRKPKTEDQRTTEESE